MRHVGTGQQETCNKQDNMHNRTHVHAIGTGHKVHEEQDNMQNRKHGKHVQQDNMQNRTHGQHAKQDNMQHAIRTGQHAACNKNRTTRSMQ
jgi:hypothetical protein